MNKLSVGAAAGIQIGRAEAQRGNSAAIKREHLMIGLCSLEKALVPRVATDFAGGQVEALHAEADSVEAFFRHLMVSPIAVRRAVRRRLETSVKSTGEEPQLSLECDDVILRAGELARKHGAYAICAVHLLVILLQSKHDDIAVAVHNAGLAPPELAPLLEKWLEIGGLDWTLERTPGPKVYGSETPFLDAFSKDLTLAASKGKLSPVVGRRNELLQLIRTLNRRTKNVPVLIGEPGVGKTAIVEGLAQRIVSGKALPGMRVVSISVGSMLAGTKYRGDFEERMLRLMEESRKNPSIIIFFDEIHTLIGAGEATNGVGAADILKPALANGEMRCIGATTTEEYRRLIDADAALERRMQPIFVAEPSPEAAREMLKSTKSALERHHGVQIGEDALSAALDLSIRYIHDRRLPDKALDALDEACALVKTAGLYIDDREPLTAQERKIVSRNSVAEVISQWTRIPVQRLSEAETQNLLRLESELLRRVVGQDDAIGRVARRIRRARVGLHETRRPVGVFLFVGGTGVGKTELARALAEVLFNSDSGLIRLDMTEFQEPHTVSKLIGAPPGYVGHEKDGILTGKLRSQPYSMVLMDEIDKAHPDVLNVFLQVFEDGRLTDAKGRLIPCTDAVFVMTANRRAASRRPGFESGDQHDLEAESVLTALRQDFRPEFLNRVDEIILFRQLDLADAMEIVRRRIDDLRRRVLDRQRIVLRVDDHVIGFIARSAHSESAGARELNRAIEKLIEEPVSDQILSGKLRERDQVIVQVGGDRLLFQTTSETE